MFIDWIGIILLMVPIMTPVAAALGFDPVWFGVMVCVNLQMAFMTAVASGIFITKGMCKPEWGITMGDIIRGVYPFVGLVIIGLVLFSIFLEIVTWLPGQMLGMITISFVNALPGPDGHSPPNLGRMPYRS